MQSARRLVKGKRQLRLGRGNRLALNPRAMSTKVKGFVSAQSWFLDLTLVSME
jgi:hypothetical protein